MLHQKMAAKFLGKDTDAMKALAVALTHRDLGEFEAALLEFRDQLSADVVIQRHISQIHETLLEQNLLRVIEPFSRVEISHVARLVNLPLRQVESKLSQLILDEKIRGILDQGANVLEIFDEQKSDKTYADAIDTIKRMGSVVHSLYEKVHGIYL